MFETIDNHADFNIYICKTTPTHMEVPLEDEVGKSPLRKAS